MFSKIFKAILILVISNFAIKILGFIRELIIAYYYGTGPIADAFNNLMIYPNIILNTIAPATGILLVSKIISEKESNKINFTWGRHHSYLLALFVLLTISFSWVITYITAGHNYILFIEVILLSYIIFLQVNMVYFFQSIEKFTIGAISSVLQVFISIVILLSISHYITSVHILLLATLVGLLSQIVFLKICYKKTTISMNVIKKSGTNNEANIYKNLFVTILSLGVMELFISITKISTNYINLEGMISGVNYSYKIINLPITIVLISVMSVMFPEFSKSEKNGDVKSIRLQSVHIIRMLLLLFIPICISLYFTSREVIYLIYARGSFDMNSVYTTSYIFKYLIWLVPLVAIYSVLIRVQIVNKLFGSILKSNIISIFLLLILQAVSVFTNNIGLLFVSLIITLLILVMLQMQSLKLNVTNIIGIKTIATTAILFITQYYLISINGSAFTKVSWNIIITFILYISLLIIFKSKDLKQIKHLGRR